MFCLFTKTLLSDTYRSEPQDPTPILQGEMVRDVLQRIDTLTHGEFQTPFWFPGGFYFNF